jgi:phage recombination protein Bet
MNDSPDPPPATAAVAVRDDQATQKPAIYGWDPQYQRLVKKTILKPSKREATNYELAMFAEQVRRTGLNPFARQIYGIYRFDKRVGDEVMQVQAGIDGFRLVAERTGKYEGQAPQEWCAQDGIWVGVWTQPEHPFAARVGVFKTGRRDATYAVAHWSEYVQTDQQGKPQGLWKTMPANQLSKCAEALALRKAFPAELSGVYTVDEMGQATNQRNGGEDVTAGVGGGRSESGEPLPDEVEAVLERARVLGHAGVADRASAEWALRGRDERDVARWVAGRTRDLDVFAAGHADPPDTEIVAVPDNEKREAMRRRAIDLLNDADALDAEGNTERALDARTEAEQLMDQASPPPEQERWEL